MFFPLITKNLNWEIYIYIYTFKRCDGVKDENL